MLAERWRIHYNTIRPHSALNYRSPAPETRAVGKTACLSVSLALDRLQRAELRNMTQKGHFSQIELDVRIRCAFMRRPEKTARVIVGRHS